MLSLAGAAFIARLINKPLRELSFAASRMRDGDFDASRLDEKVATSEIREVNIGFNRMAAQLSKVEQDRVDRRPDRVPRLGTRGRRFAIDVQRQRKGMNEYKAKRYVRQRDYFGPLMLRNGDTDALIVGFSKNYTSTLIHL